MKTLFFSLLTVALLACGQSGEKTSEKKSPELLSVDNLERIDTHIHLYDTRREPVVFPSPKHKQIYFPHMEPEFKRTANPAGVQFAVVVEASPLRKDNFWLMAHIDTSASLLGFIANLDPRDPMFAHDVDSLAGYDKFSGVRIRPEKSIDISDPEIYNRFIELEKRKLVLELEFNHIDVEWETVIDLARKFPKMNIVIDHVAAVKFTDGKVQMEDFEEELKLLASAPNVYCKISALFGKSGITPAPTDEAFYRPLIDPVVDAFGTERVMFGSNWTLSALRGTYTDMIEMYDAYLKYRTDLPPQNLYFNNAVKAYGLSIPECR